MYRASCVFNKKSLFLPKECGMDQSNLVKTISLILVIVGGLNWGLVGLAGLNLVDLIFGVGSILSKSVYALVGLSAVLQIYYLLADS